MIDYFFESINKKALLLTGLLFELISFKPVPQHLRIFSALDP